MGNLISSGINDINQASNIASSSPASKHIVSELMGFGSFSGADIKVIVHHPFLGEIKNQLNAAKQNAEYELAKEAQAQQLYSVSDVFDNASQSSVAKSLDRQTSLERTLTTINEEIDRIREIPTSQVLGEIQTFSYSVYREKVPIRPLGAVYPKSFVRGSRTIGGSMIFTVIHQHVLHEILSLNMGMYNTGVSDHDQYTYTTNLPDQLPPLDISIIFANEYGALSYMGIYGVEFIQEGATFSIHDIYSESVVQYVARDIDPIRLLATREIDGSGVTSNWVKTASSLTDEKNSANNHLIRRDPFI